MNLRKVERYDIGLDMGTGSVGWAVVDADTGELLRFKGKPTWGSRLFPSADTAASTRLNRGQRRRYERRRWRLNFLQEFFAEEMSKVDSDFFIRLRQARLLPEDRIEGHDSYRWPLFNDSDFTEKDYYKKFPTIYHLRAWLMETSEKADVRLIYLAFHNIVKSRGNFLRQGQTISARNAKMDDAVQELHAALFGWLEERGDGFSCSDPGDESASCKILKILEDDHMAKSDKKKQVAACLKVAQDGVANNETKKIAEAIAASIVGLQIDVGTLFGCDLEKEKIYLSKEEDVESFSGVCPDEGIPLFEAMQSAYAAYLLQGMLSYAPGKTISANKIKEYERYKQDLQTLKSLVKEFAPQEYENFFRGAVYEGTNIYDPGKAYGYTKYDAVRGGTSYDDLKKEVQKIFEDTDAESDERYRKVLDGFSEGTFLRRLKTSDNGSIYYQLHLEEMEAIADNQSRHYPFLDENREKLVSLVVFRIPYYVGPLTTLNAAKEKPGSNTEGALRFAWSIRKEGQEHASIKPWNWEDIIDRNASAEAFIKRMTGTCTYLQGEDVLPKCSLLYEEYCVLNELNGSQWTQDGDDWHRFDALDDRQGLINDLFKKGKVSYKQVANWMGRIRGHMHVHVKSGQGETGFESKLGSHIFFCRDVFHVSELPYADIPMIEEIILWNTLFEDRKILKDKIREKYGDRLDEDQIKTICKKRFTGWGRLSKRLLIDLKVNTDVGSQSIMDILREGNPNSGHRARPMVLMEILRDDEFGFEDAIVEHNKAYLENLGGRDINDLPGSPALRRSINQALRIVEEIVSIAGKPPRNIFIEVTRDDDARNKGKRTQRRYKTLLDAYEAFKADDPQLWQELKSRSPQDLDERLTLYFMQRGKCLYSGRAIDINQLSNAGMYEVDHILPQTYIKDDSFDNKALVCRANNQRKTDTLLLDPAIRSSQAFYWKSLVDAKLISEKKYKNLTRSSVNEQAMKGFIARQLVETSQVVKMTQQLLDNRYPETSITPIKAGMSSQIREQCGFVKCREINNYHHAHDAYLACRMGQFINMRHEGVFKNPIGMTRVMRDFIRSQGSQYQKTRRVPGSGSFLVASFLRPGFDKETGEIFKDTWDPDQEIGGIRRALNYKDCFISRMPEETAGAFWDATIYSPRTGKNLGLPLKQDLAVEKYGSYSREQFAYFFVYKAYDSKKQEYRFEFEPVPVRVASSVDSQEDALEQYASQLANEKGLEFVEVSRPKVYKYQLIQLGNDRLYITGKEEVRNATEFAFSQYETEVFKRLAENLQTLTEERIELFECLREKFKRYAPRLNNTLKVDNFTEAFWKADENDQSKTLLLLVSITAAKVNRIDLTGLGGSKYAGGLQPVFSKELSLPDSNFVFIDQSITGMFEREQHLEL